MVFAFVEVALTICLAVAEFRTFTERYNRFSLSAISINKTIVLTQNILTSLFADLKKGFDFIFFLAGTATITEIEHDYDRDSG